MTTPLLVSKTIKVVCDAARATKRQAELLIEAVTAGTLSRLLGLPGMVVTSYALAQENEREIVHIFCEHAYEVAVCPRCGQVATGVHERQERCIRHRSLWGKATFVHFPARRFACETCGKPFSEELSWIESQRRESAAYELYIYQECQQMTQAALAQREVLHPETVKLIFERWAKRAEAQQKRPAVRTLGIDEIALRKGHQHFALVLSDLERHCVIAVLEERSQEALTTWLAGLTASERHGIRVVAMDMWGPYRGVVKSQLPKAEIVADRFHMTKHLNDAVTQIRRSLQANANKTDCELLKGTRWLLVKRRADLKPEEEVKLGAVLQAFPTLRTAYLLKEKFQTIADKIQNRPQAERFLRAWLYEAQASALPQLLKFTKTLQNWWDEFLNYFNQGVTSAVVEGLNNAIRAIIRRAFGYPVFETFRLHVIVQHGMLNTPLPPI
jgi:transposase